MTMRRRSGFLVRYGASDSQSDPRKSGLYKSTIKRERVSLLRIVHVFGVAAVFVVFFLGAAKPITAEPTIITKTPTRAPAELTTTAPTAETSIREATPTDPHTWSRKYFGNLDRNANGRERDHRIINLCPNDMGGIDGIV